MNFGQLYFWQGGAIVQAYEFKPFEIYAEETEWPGEYRVHLTDLLRFI